MDIALERRSAVESGSSRRKSLVRLFDDYQHNRFAGNSLHFCFQQKEKSLKNYILTWVRMIGEVAERSNATVLKTVNRESGSRVRIPASPPDVQVRT